MLTQRTRSTTLLIPFLLAIYSPLIFGSSAIIQFDESNGETLFHARGRPSSLKINGHGKAPKGQLEWKENQIQGKLQVDLESFDTGISKRNQHMKEIYLETKQYPYATLTIEDLSAPNEYLKKDFDLQDVPFKGKLNLHNSTQTVAGKAKARRKGNKLQIEAEFPTKISDYQIKVPSFAGITVADEVKVQVKTTAVLEIQQ